VEPHPHTQFPEVPSQIAMRALSAARPEPGAVLEIHAVGSRVLGNHQQLLHARFHRFSASRITSPIGRLARSPRRTDDAEVQR